MKDRPKGMTQEAKTRLPMIFSNSLKIHALFSQTRSIRPKYLSIFFAGREHMRFVESKTIPRMFILLAGGKHFSGFMCVFVNSPNNIKLSSNNFAFFCPFLSNPCGRDPQRSHRHRRKGRWARNNNSENDVGRTFAMRLSTCKKPLNYWLCRKAYLGLWAQGINLGVPIRRMDRELTVSIFEVGFYEPINIV